MKYNFDMRKVTTPLLITLIGKEMRFPTLFMLKCKLTVGQLKKRIPSRFPQDFVDWVSLPVWVYINLKAKIGQRKALEIMRIALLTGGTASLNLFFDPVHTERTFDHLIEKELEGFQTGMIRWNQYKIVERTSRRFELHVVACHYYELAVSLGIPELIPMICLADNAFHNSYLADQVRFHRGGVNQRIVDGAAECTFIWENSEQAGKNGS